MAHKIGIITGSVRKGRNGTRVAKFLEAQCIAHGWGPTIIEPCDYDLPMIDKMYKEFEEGKAPENLEKLHRILLEQDGYLIVTAEYNHSLPPALTNLLNHFMPEYLYKPAGIVSYSVGSFGGVRAAVHARVLVGEVGMVTIPTMFPISLVGKSLDEDGKALEDAYNKRVVKFLREFRWYVDALKVAREKGIPK